MLSEKCQCEKVHIFCWGEGCPNINQIVDILGKTLELAKGDGKFMINETRKDFTMKLNISGVVFLRFDRCLHIFWVIIGIALLMLARAFLSIFCYIYQKEQPPLN